MTTWGAGAAEWQMRWHELVKAVVRVHSPSAEEQLLDSLARPDEPLVLAFVNSHAMNSAATSREFFDAVMSADLVLRDGIGMQILLSLLHQPPGLNLNGTDLIPRIMRRYAGRPIALFGTQEPYLGRAQAVVVCELAPGSTCITANGFLDTAVLCPAGRGPQAQPDRAGHGHAQAGGGRRDAQGGAGVSLPHRLRRRDHRFSRGQDSQGAALDAPHRA